MTWLMSQRDLAVHRDWTGGARKYRQTKLTSGDGGAEGRRPGSHGCKLRLCAESWVETLGEGLETPDLCQEWGEKRGSGFQPGGYHLKMFARFQSFGGQLGHTFGISFSSLSVSLGARPHVLCLFITDIVLGHLFKACLGLLV